MWKGSLLLLLVIYSAVDFREAAEQCSQSDKKACLPTNMCKLSFTNYVTENLCGFDDQTKHPLVCCHPSNDYVESYARPILATPYTVHLTSFLNNVTKFDTIVKVPTSLKSLDELRMLENVPVLIRHKMARALRYKRTPEMELFTSPPLTESEAAVVPNPVALGIKPTEPPPMPLFTSPPFVGDENALPLQSQSSKPDTSSIMNLFTSPPLLPDRANPIPENPTTPSPTKPANTTPKPANPRPTPTHARPTTTKPTQPKSKKPHYPIDTRPIVYIDTSSTTPSGADQIYFPDNVPGLPQNELDSKANALSLTGPEPPPHAVTLDKILPSRHTCGYHRESKRFPDAGSACVDEFPWVALLRYSDNFSNDAGFRCVGTLISDRYVLTAAHCLGMNSLHLHSVRLGEWEISTTQDCVYFRGKSECADKVQDVKVEKRIIHPRYDDNSRNNDVAILRLQHRVHFTDFVRPICLPIQNLQDPQLGSTFTTSGWGTTPFGFQLNCKSKINFPVIHRSYCKEYRYFKEQTCIGYENRHDFGKMDPGGPVMALDVTDKPQWYLEGVLTRGYGCNLLSYPGAYTRLTYYIDWLTSTLLHDARS